MKLTTFCPYPFPFIYLFNSILPDTFSWNISFYFTVTTATTAWQLDSVISINFNHNHGSIPWMVWKLSWYFAQKQEIFQKIHIDNVCHVLRARQLLHGVMMQMWTLRNPDKCRLFKKCSREICDNIFYTSKSS